MRALHLDYHASAETFRLRAVLLASGALLAVFAGVEYLSVHEELATWEAKVAALRKTAGGGAVDAPKTPRETETSAQEVKVAYGALQRLALPWGTLFGALESVQTNGVALLALEPDAVKSTIKLMAEAKSDTDMLNYLQRLQSVDTLAEVTLASHETKQGDPSRPLRFVVFASWKKQP